jgi:hypothetical protein
MRQSDPEQPHRHPELAAKLPEIDARGGPEIAATASSVQATMARAHSTPTIMADDGHSGVIRAG